MATPTPQEHIKLTGTKLRETEKAVHFRVEMVGENALVDSVTHWFPFSQISKQTYNPSEDKQDTVHVAEWICRQKELV